MNMGKKGFGYDLVNQKRSTVFTQVCDEIDATSNTAANQSAVPYLFAA